MNRSWFFLLVCSALSFLLAAPASAHPMSMSELTLELLGNRYEGRLLLDSPPERSLDARKRKATIERQVRGGLYVKADGAPQHYELKVEALGNAEGEGLDATDRVRIAGRMPDGASDLSLRVAPRFGALKLRVGDETGRNATWTLPAGGQSPPLVQSLLRTPERTEAPFGAFEASALETSPLATAPAESPRRLATAAHHVRLGFEHILPYGLDHVLFVLALFFFSPRFKPLLIQLTSFTLAHSLTLGLAVAGVMSPPESVVEPLIAASILFVGVENLWRRRLGPTRIFVVAGFGLLHGMGFAGALGEIGLPPGQEWIALGAFNVGVELGQIAVVLLALGLTWRTREQGEHPRWVRVPASGAIAAVGLFWVVERVLA